MTNGKSPEDGITSGITPNPQQKKAIKASGDRLRIIAGPGTGKTETLTRRIVYLIDEKGVSPASIIAFTFTEKAADELLARVESHLGSLENRPWVGTIHSFCLELLEDYHEEVFDGDYTVLGEEGQLVFLYTHYNDLDLKKVEFPLDSIAAHFSKAMDLGIDPDDYVRFAKRSFQRVQSIPDHRPDKRKKLNDVKDRRSIAQSYKAYHELMAEQNTIDYPTMIQHALELLKNNEKVRSDIATEYTHLLVDEYQDTNRTPEALVSELVELGCDLCVVGDDDQSIYRFRGATVDNLLEFDERFNRSQSISIDINYRSDISIVKSSQEVIKNNERRLQKEIIPDSSTKGFIGYVQKGTQDTEAAAICDYIEEQLKSGKIDSLNDIAFLFRSVVRDAEPYISALRNRGFPVEVTGLADVFEEELVEEILTTLEYLVEGSKENVESVVQSDLFDLCETSRENFINNNSISCGHSSCMNVIKSLQELSREYEADTFVEPQSLFYEILSCSPKVEDFLGVNISIEVSEKLRFLAGLSDVIGQIEQITEHTTLEYLRDLLLLVQDYGVEPELPDRAGGINVMTVHQAKGLEFPIVVLPSLIDGKFPTSERPNPLQIPSQLRKEPEYKGGDDHIADERRLFYVAMTRAEHQVIVAHSNDGERSRFINEIPKSNLTEIDPEPSLAKVDRRFSLQRQKELETTSFTQISYFTQCPLRYGLLFDYGFERTEQPQFYYGISVHRALERFFSNVLEGAAPVQKKLLNELETAWISRGYISGEQEKRFKSKARDILINYLNSNKNSINRIEYVEHPFSILIDDIRVEGKMDRVDQLSSGKLRIIDFKIGETEEPGPWEVFQLQLYALACERTIDAEVDDCRFHFLSSDEQLKIKYDDTTRRETLQKLRSVLADMKSQEYRPNPGPYCERCDFRGFCPAVQSD